MKALWKGNDIGDYKAITLKQFALMNFISIKKSTLINCSRLVTRLPYERKHLEKASQDDPAIHD